MRHEQLKNHIKGSFLKEEYLESFLVQSAYIESFLKIYADFNSWKSCGGVKMDDDPILVTLYKQIQRYNLNELIDFLHKSKLISDEQKKLLNNYREKRNKILHDLIQEISKETFEKELKETCVVGNKIIDGEEFKKIHQLIDFVEKEKESDNALKKELPNISSEKNQNSFDRDGSAGKPKTA